MGFRAGEYQRRGTPPRRAPKVTRRFGNIAAPAAGLSPRPPDARGYAVAKYPSGAGGMRPSPRGFGEIT